MIAESNVMFIKLFAMEMYERLVLQKEMTPYENKYFLHWFRYVWSNYGAPLKDEFFLYDIHDYEGEVRKLLGV